MIIKRFFLFVCVDLTRDCMNTRSLKDEMKIQYKMKWMVFFLFWLLMLCTSYVRALLKFESSRKRFDVHPLTINYDGYITSVFCPVFLQRNPRNRRIHRHGIIVLCIKQSNKTIHEAWKWYTSTLRLNYNNMTSLLSSWLWTLNIEHDDHLNNERVPIKKPAEPRNPR